MKEHEHPYWHTVQTPKATNDKKLIKEMSEHHKALEKGDSSHLPYGAAISNRTRYDASGKEITPKEKYTEDKNNLNIHTDDKYHAHRIKKTLEEGKKLFGGGKFNNVSITKRKEE